MRAFFKFNLFIIWNYSKLFWEFFLYILDIKKNVWFKIVGVSSWQVFAQQYAEYCCGRLGEMLIQKHLHTAQSRHVRTWIGPARQSVQAKCSQTYCHLRFEDSTRKQGRQANVVAKDCSGPHWMDQFCASALNTIVHFHSGLLTKINF